MEAEYEKENVLPVTNGVRALNNTVPTTHRRRKRSAKQQQQVVAGTRPVSSIDTTKSVIPQLPKNANAKRKHNNGVSRRQALSTTTATPMQDLSTKQQQQRRNTNEATATTERKSSTPSVKSTLRALQKKFRTKRSDERGQGAWCEGGINDGMSMHDSIGAAIAAVMTGDMKEEAIVDSRPSISNDLCTGELISDGVLESYDDVEDVECVETQMCQSMVGAPTTAISVEDYITATPARCASAVTEVDGPTAAPVIPEDEEEMPEDYPDLDDEVDAEPATHTAPTVQAAMPVWRVTRVNQSWAQPPALGPEFPCHNPSLTSEQELELDACRQWLLTVVRALWDVVPDHLKQGATPICMLAEDLAMPATAAVRFPIDPDADAGAALLSTPGEESPVHISNRFMRETIARWNAIRPLKHLPTLNLFYCLFENLLLIGRNLPVVLSKHTVVKVVEMMQYNPKLNARMAEWPLHAVAMSKRKTDVKLPDYVTELAEVIYAMQYIKDRIIPWVCDESRFGNFNQYLARLKANILRYVVEDDDILREIFTVLQDPFQPISVLLPHLRFLQEFLEMQKADNLTDGKLCWEVLLNQYHFIPVITVHLGSSDPRVRKASADVCLYLTEEDCRPLLQPHLIEHTDFLHRLLDIFKNPECDEALALQLQTFLPMLMVFPIVDVLPIFYSACGDVVAHWTTLCQQNDHVFCPNKMARRATIELDPTGVAPAPVSSDAMTVDVSSNSSSSQKHSLSIGASLPSAMCVNAFLEMASLCVHHHHRSFAFHSDEFVQRLVALLATLWGKAASVPADTLIASNKVMLSLLHLQSDNIYTIVKEHRVFEGILLAFEDGNNALNSSVLTLLHTILQLDIGALIVHIHDLWFNSSCVSPQLDMDACSVVRLFAERVVRGDLGPCGSL